MKLKTSLWLLCVGVIGCKQIPVSVSYNDNKIYDNKDEMDGSYSAPTSYQEEREMRRNSGASTNPTSVARNTRKDRNTPQELRQPSYLTPTKKTGEKVDIIEKDPRETKDPRSTSEESRYGNSYTTINYTTNNYESPQGREQRQTGSQQDGWRYSENMNRRYDVENNKYEYRSAENTNAADVEYSRSKNNNAPQNQLRERETTTTGENTRIERKTENFKYITVKEGDNLSKIAAENNTSIARIAELNNLEKPYKIYVRQKLKVPANGNIERNTVATVRDNSNDTRQLGTVATREEKIINGYRYAIVKKGDSLLRIALDYNKTLTELARLNSIEYPFNIRIGQKIKIGPVSGNTIQDQPTKAANANKSNKERKVLQNGNKKYIIVQKGDNLIEIARKTNTTVLTLAEMNNLQPPYKLLVGQKLQVAGAIDNTKKTTYKVESGDNLYAIARKFDVNVSGLIKANNLKSPNNIYAGQVLTIPTGRSDYSIEKTASLSETREGTKPAPAVQKVETPKSNSTIKVNKVNGFMWPLEGEVISTFGKKDDGTYNDGIKIKAAKGTPVKASMDGEIAYAGNELKGYGNIIIIRHDNGWLSIYAHCDTLSVKLKDKVKQGNTIATVGSTGDVNSPQLYFGLRRGRTAMDPIGQLKK